MNQNDLLTFSSIWDFLSQLLRMGSASRFIFQEGLSTVDVRLQHLVTLRTAMTYRSAGGLRIMLKYDWKHKYVSTADLEPLWRMDRSDWPEKYWVALNFARDWARANGNDPENSMSVMFEKYFNEDERRLLIKLMRMARFSALFRNMRWFREPWQGPSEEDVPEHP